MKSETSPVFKPGFPPEQKPHSALIHRPEAPRILRGIKVAPSILSADFGRLADEVLKVSRAGADLLHIDVMDGHFVPNITLGPVVIKDIPRSASLPLDTHLMISRPLELIDSFLAAGSNMITLHIETVSPRQIKEWSLRLKERRVRLGVSLNPGTPLKKIESVLGLVDFILVMSVNPGFAGQGFINAVVPKIRKLRAAFKGDISVDGGINDQTAKIVVEAGANVLVAGSYIFKSDNYREAIRRLKACAVMRR